MYVRLPMGRADQGGHRSASADQDCFIGILAAGRENSRPSSLRTSRDRELTCWKWVACLSGLGRHGIRRRLTGPMRSHFCRHETIAERLVALAAALALLVPAHALAAEELLDPDVAFRFSAKMVDRQAVQ